MFHIKIIKRFLEQQKIKIYIKSSLPYITIFLIMTFIMPDITLTQGKYVEEWIQGHVTSISKDSISVDNIRYQFDILLTIKDSNGNILKPVALRNAEIVKVLERNGKALKIVIIEFRK